MPGDANAVLQAGVTKTATFNGAGFDLGSAVGGPRGRSLEVEVLYSAATNASGSNSVTFSVDGSDDNSTFNNIANAADQTVNLSTTVQTGVIYIPVDSIHRYIRVTATFAGAGSTPTITYTARLVAARP